MSTRNDIYKESGYILKGLSMNYIGVLMIFKNSKRNKNGRYVIIFN